MFLSKSVWIVVFSIPEGMKKILLIQTDLLKNLSRIEVEKVGQAVSLDIIFVISETNHPVQPSQPLYVGFLHACLSDSLVFSHSRREMKRLGIRQSGMQKPSSTSSSMLDLRSSPDPSDPDPLASPAGE